ANPDVAKRVNTHATTALGRTGAQVGARLVFSSTDMVFAGDDAPYREADEPRPRSHYGRTKLAAEQALRGLPGCLVVRIPLMFGLPCTSRKTTFADQLAALREGRPLRLFTDEFRTPIHVEDAARALLALARSALTGVIHVAGPERLSRFELVARSAAGLG